MTKTKDIIQKDGLVKEALMGGMFKVEFSDQTVALASLSGKMRKFRIRILTGDRVLAEFSPHDLTRGRITYRYKPSELGLPIEVEEAELEEKI